jgi:hypothetical protein
MTGHNVGVLMLVLGTRRGANRPLPPLQPLFEHRPGELDVTPTRMHGRFPVRTAS